LNEISRECNSLSILVLKKLLSDRVAMVGVCIIVLILLLALLAPMVAPYPPKEMQYDSVLTPPSRVHWFGTDELGRDTLSRVIWGGRETLASGLISIVVGLSGGILVGTISAYFGGVLDLVIQRIVEIFQAFPNILLLLSIIAIIGPGLTTAMISIGLSWIPGYSRLVRGLVLSERNYDYVDAARAIGASDWRIMFRHVLPNIAPQLLVYATVDLGFAVMLTAGLSYIGLGAQPPSPEWGAMLNYGRSYINTAWWVSVFPGLAIFSVVLSANLFGDGLRDALDPHIVSRNRRLVKDIGV
jgi:peptide/nickel transport system permease protein